MDNCSDNRFLIIERAKKDLLESTNISSSDEEMAVVDNFLFRCWQMGWLGKYDLEFIKGKELAKKFLDAIIYDNDYVNRWNPLDEEKHYGLWIDEVGRGLKRPIQELGAEFFTDEMIDTLSIGDYDEMMAIIGEHPCLRYLNELLNKYDEYLSKLPWNVPGKADADRDK